MTILSKYKLAGKLSVFLAVVFTCIPSIADDFVQYPTYSPDIHLGHTKGVLADEDAAFQTGTGLNTVNFGNLPGSVDIDAVHGLANGDVLFSLDTSTTLGGTLYRPYDVIRFDGSTWSKELDGGSAGIPDGINVDAISMSGETLVLSFDIGAQLGGVSVDDSDVIAFDGENFSIFLDASEIGIETAADLDAVHIDDQGRVLVSFDGAGVIEGIQYRDEDMLAWVSPDWSIEFDGSTDDVAWQPADLDAWSVVFINDNIFLDGFE